jgi:hypothetical protein
MTRLPPAHPQTRWSARAGARVGDEGTGVGVEEGRGRSPLLKAMKVVVVVARRAHWMCVEKAPASVCAHALLEKAARLVRRRVKSTTGKRKRKRKTIKWRWCEGAPRLFESATMAAPRATMTDEESSGHRLRAQGGDAVRALAMHARTPALMLAQSRLRCSALRSHPHRRRTALSYNASGCTALHARGCSRVPRGHNSSTAWGRVARVRWLVSGVACALASVRTARGGVRPQARHHSTKRSRCTGIRPSTLHPAARTPFPRCPPAILCTRLIRSSSTGPATLRPRPWAGCRAVLRRSGAQRQGAWTRARLRGMRVVRARILWACQ